MVARRLRRVEGQVGEEIRARRGAGGDLRQLHQVRRSDLGILVDALQMRTVPALDGVELRRPGQLAITQRPHQSREVRPSGGGCRRRLPPGERGKGINAAAISTNTRQEWAEADARQQLQHPEAGEAVARIFGPSQHGEHILHDAQDQGPKAPAEFDERDAPPRQLDLEVPRMARGAEQHGLLFQRHPGLAVLEHAVSDVAGLLDLVANADQPRPLLEDHSDHSSLGSARAPG